MSCDDYRKRLNALLDGELSTPEAEDVKQHVDQCEACQREAGLLRRLSMAMDDLPLVRPPSSLSRKTKHLFRENLEKQGFSEWWQGLSLSLRGAVCGAALAGLVFGAVLATTLPGSSPSPPNPYLNLYASQEYIP